MRGVFYRSIGLVAIVGLLAAGAFWWTRQPQDVPVFDVPPVNSAGFIAAIQEKEGTDRLVAISPSGEIREASGDADVVDSELAWKPDGKRIVFVSNRSEDGSPQIFEWKPDRENRPFMLTPTGASRQNPVWNAKATEILYTSRGDVFALQYPSRQTVRVMPPSDAPDFEHGEDGGESDHSGHQHDIIAQAWESISKALEGEAFTKGFVSADGKQFAGIYSTSRGKAFVMQNLVPEDEHEAAARVPLAGDDIQISLHPTEPKCVVAVTNFRYPILSLVPKEKRNADGTVKRDFVNGIFLANLETGELTPIFVSVDGKQLMDSPALSPDGSQLLLVFKSRAGGGYVASDLIAVPADGGGVARARPLARGPISQPSWSADGSRVAFVRDGDIFTVSAEAGDERNVTHGKGKFSSPQFSPMR
jgi:dipeptidyl aminopeptidase/acylaminoacyl peptidase